jgi:glycosyltransferase involved in cell wall biosynthesis
MASLTVALATCNRSGYLARIIPTILAQTFRDFELLILDNASTDDTAAVVKSFADPRVSYFRHAENIGGYPNLNASIDMARSEFLIILHDDDLLEPELFAREVEALRADPGLAMVTCDGHLIDADDTVTSARALGLPTRDFQPLEYVEAYVLHGRSLFLPAHMYRLSRLRALGLRFQPEIGNGADAFFVNRLNLTERIRFLGEPLFRYRVHTGQWCRQLHAALRSGFQLWTAFIELDAESGGRLDPFRPPILSKLRDSFGFLFLAHCFGESAEPIRVAKFLREARQLPQSIRAELSLDPKFRLLMSVCAPAQDWCLPGASGVYEWADVNWVRNQRAFAAWETLRDQGHTLTHRLAAAGVRRVVIFGATLIGYLLQEDLAANGIEVVAFLENRSENIGLHFCGRPVAAPDWLDNHGAQVQAALTACFSAADLEIAERFRKAPLAAPAWVAGWRELLLAECPELLLAPASTASPQDLLEVA